MRHLEARNEVVFAFSDHGKAARVFGEGGDHPGGRACADGALGEGRRGTKERSFGDIEIEQGLPPSWRDQG